ncbi:MAG: PAS domain S-box protein [Desulfarculus sp.]|nr:PAS domain S-box protein [Desulfarculus sp.]
MSSRKHHKQGEAASIQDLRRQLDQALELAAILDQAAVAVLASGLDHRLTYWNQGAARLYGWSPAEALGQISHQLLSTGLPQPLAEIEARLTETGHWRGELRHLTRQGQILVVESHWGLRRDPEGRPLAIVAVEHDLTQRKAAEQALKQSEERYRRLFEDDLTGDYLATPQGQILACNPAFLRLFGLASQEEALATNLAGLYPQAREFAGFVERLGQEGRLEHHQCQRRGRDGSLFHAVENVVGEFDGQGQLLAIKGYLFDDTARYLAEQALRHSEERYRRLFEDDLTGDYLATPQGQILACNPAFLGLFGLASQEESQARDLASLYPQPRDFTDFLDLVRRKGKLEHYQCQRRRRDGSLFHAVENVVGEFDGQGELLGKEGEQALLKKDREITLQLQKIEKLNAALTTLLERREQEGRQKEEDILATVEQLVLPHLHALQSTRLDDDQRLHLEVLAGNLKNITSSFARRLATWKTKLTPSEIKVADLIRQGKSSKEVASLLRISSHAVAFHRANLRAKLGLRGGGGNLASHLRHII